MNHVTKSLEAVILKTERIKVKFLNGDHDGVIYAKQWVFPAPPRTLIANWLIHRVKNWAAIEPHDVVLTLPDGNTITGDKLITDYPKLRMGDLRFGDAYRPDGMRNVPVGVVENRILAQDGIVIIIRRPATTLLPYPSHKAADPRMTILKYVSTRLAEYGLQPEEIVIIHGETMIPFVPSPYYTIGQLRETFKGKGK